MSLSRRDYCGVILENFLKERLGYIDFDAEHVAKAYEQAHEHFATTDTSMLSDYRLATVTHLDMAILYGYICKPAKIIDAFEYGDLPIIQALAPSRQEFLAMLLDYARVKSTRTGAYKSYHTDEFREFFDYFKSMVGQHQRDFRQSLEHTTIVSPEAAVDDDRCESDYADEYVTQVMEDLQRRYDDA